LRIIWYSDYVRDIWGADEFGKARDKVAKQVGEQMRSAHKAASGAESEISDSRAIAWLEEATSDEIAIALKVAADKKSKFVANLERSRSAILSTAKHSSPFMKLAVLRAGIDGQSVEAAASKLVEKAQGATLPDDVFMLPGVPGYDARPAIVLMRQVVAVLSTDVVLSRHDATDESHLVRVGRLLETFKYALSQAFGHLYARIGLPTSYEARQRNARASIDHKEWK